MTFFFKEKKWKSLKAWRTISQNYYQRQKSGSLEVKYKEMMVGWRLLHSTARYFRGFFVFFNKYMFHPGSGLCSQACYILTLGSLRLFSQALTLPYACVKPVEEYVTGVTFTSQASGEGFCGSWGRKVNKSGELIALSDWFRTVTGKFIRTEVWERDKRGHTAGVRDCRSDTAAAVGGEVNSMLPFYSCFFAGCTLREWSLHWPYCS